MPDSRGHEAVGPAAGYFFQAERALYHLASGPRGSKVGIEALGDVTRFSNGALVWEEDKSSIDPTGIPLSDRSKNLWNTLNIWINAIQADKVDLDKTNFILVTNKVLPDNCLARVLSTSDNTKSAANAVTMLRQVGVDPPLGIRALVEHVLSCGNDFLSDFIQKISVCDANDHTFGAGLKDLVYSSLHIPERLDHELIFQSLLGWVHDTVLDYWRSYQPAWITRESFDNFYNNVLFSLRNRAFTETVKTLLPVTQEQRNDNREKIFVRQLSIVSIPDDEVDDQIIEAIDDFVRSCNERTRLSHEGYLTKDDFKAFDDRLIDRWKGIYRRTRREYQLGRMSQEDAGYTILTSSLDHREILAGRQTEEFYLTKGSYHKLADSLTVGWHPNYEAILRGDKR